VKYGVEQGECEEHRKIGGPPETVSDFFESGPIFVDFIPEGNIAKVCEVDPHGVVEDV